MATEVANGLAKPIDTHASSGAMNKREVTSSPYQLQLGGNNVG